MKTLGTYLPTTDSMKRGDIHANAIEKQQRQIGATLRGCDARIVGGETRYYKSAARYAVVSRGIVVRWFDVRADGDYPAAA